jgi:4-hydroxybutyrate CoA-transferase
MPARTALSGLGAGSRVIATPGCATPQTLLHALGAWALEAGGMRLDAGLLLGDLPFAAAVRSGQLEFRTWHVMGPGRRLSREGLVEYLPMRASEVHRHLDAGYDALLMRVSAPDARGVCSLGPSLSYTRAALAAARLVIAEIDPALPRTTGDTAIEVEDIDVLVDAEHPTCEYISAPPSAAIRAIARSVVELLPREPLLQLGIGAVPEAVAEFLGDADLGLCRFIGMASDRMVPLLQAAAGGRARMRAVELMGTATLLGFADGNPAVRMVSSRTGHNARLLSAEPRFVSVNSALIVELTGQVVSDQIGGAAVAGIGGSADFAAAAGQSAGGLRVIALPATTRSGESTIVAAVPPGAAVTIPRHDVDAVVTEYGVARLAGCSLTERAERLASIAAPALRQSLFDQWRNVSGVRMSTSSR